MEKREYKHLLIASIFHVNKNKQKQDASFP
jgi:hypothetical protein